MLSKTLNSPPKVGGRREMSVGSDEGNFSFPEECRRPFPSKRGRWYYFLG